MARTNDLTGQRFGKLTVTGKTDKVENGYCVWRCRCDCGGEILVNTKKLRRGTISDCGCTPAGSSRRGPVAEDLTGRQFGSLTVLCRAENRGGRTCWSCRCVCGKLHTATAHDLKAGKVRSCGCLARQERSRFLDLKGRRFGRLVVEEKTEQRDIRGSVVWKCRCDCGREICLSENALMHGNYRSCGCLKREVQQEIYQQLHFVDGTCVELLEKRKHRKDNASGFRGVFRMKNGRYRVSIGFKGKRYYVGSYNDYEEAVEARLEVEELIHNGFIRDYRIWKEHASEDPEWAEDNPFVFEVEKRAGTFQVTSNVRNSEDKQQAI